MPGWRALVEGCCGRCEHWYLQDLPSGHGLVYPATLDLSTGEVLGSPATEWFTGWLADAWRSPSNRHVDLTVSGPGVRGPAVLLDCLDPVYGHSLLKLLNAQRHLEHGDRELVVLVPRALHHLVPAGVREVWTLEGPPSLARAWLLRLDERLQRELDRIGDCALSAAYPHPHPSGWRLEFFTGDIAAERRGRPSFAFALRDDRPWGVTAAHQALNLHALWALLRRRFPDAGGALVGVGRPGGAPPGIEDLRSDRPGAHDERSWLSAARGADIVIGVHGSHLLLPSGLAELTLELTPSSRHGNVLQATLVTERDPVLALWRYRQILGGPLPRRRDPEARRIGSRRDGGRAFALPSVDERTGSGGWRIPTHAASPARRTAAEGRRHRLSCGGRAGPWGWRARRFGGGGRRSRHRTRLPY